MRLPEKARSSPGQALVEFSLAIMVFLVLIMAVFDFGRAVYEYNGVSQSAREIARVTSVHPGATLGASPETANVISVQQSLIPGLQMAQITCVDIAGSPVATCVPGKFVKVVARAPWTAVTPLLSFFGSFTFQSTSIVEIQ